jgi:ketopantoate reductase
MSPLRFTVLGSGSVGLAVAASYVRAGQQVTLLARGSAMGCRPMRVSSPAS